MYNLLNKCYGCKALITTSNLESFLTESLCILQKLIFSRKSSLVSKTPHYNGRQSYKNHSTILAMLLLYTKESFNEKSSYQRVLKTFLDYGFLSNNYPAHELCNQQTFQKSKKQNA